MSYRDRRTARAERLRGWAEKRAAKSTAAFESSRRIADAIPFGQPILVGHHSEAHARRDQERIHAGMSKGVEHERMAASMSSRADEIDRQAEHAIYSDDVDACARLRERIAALEAQRAGMKAKNAAFKLAAKVQLKALASAYQRDQAMPHQAYELTNLGGNISRQRARLAQLEAVEVQRARVRETLKAERAIEQAAQ